MTELKCRRVPFSPHPLWHLLFKCNFIYFLVYVVRKCSNLILLCAGVQFSQYHILKRLSFLHCIFLYLLCHRLIDHMYMCLFLGSLCYDLCVNFCFDYCSFVLLSEHQKHDISSFVLFQDFSVCVFLFYVCGSVLILGLFSLLLLSNCSVMSDSLQPHGLQHARPLCPSPSPKVFSSSCPLHW